MDLLETIARMTWDNRETDHTKRIWSKLLVPEGQRVHRVTARKILDAVYAELDALGEHQASASLRNSVEAD